MLDYNCFIVEPLKPKLLTDVTQKQVPEACPPCLRQAGSRRGRNDYSTNSKAMVKLRRSDIFIYISSRHGAFLYLFYHDYKHARQTEVGLVVPACRQAGLTGLLCQNDHFVT